MSKELAGPAPSHSYRIVLALLGALVGAGLYCYVQQLRHGLGVTGLGRDLTWGLYIGQFAFAEGLAASALVVLLPLFVHRAKAFEPLALPAVVVAIAAVTMCILFVLVDLGQPARVFNVVLHAAPTSMMFWDTVSLGGYLAINVAIALALLESRRSGNGWAAWLRPLVLLSLPWGIAVHTISAFMLGGLAGRPLWFTTIMAPRFLASAFAASAALLILICLALRRLARVDAGAEVLRALAIVMAYGLGFSLFVLLIDVFTVRYGGIPEHIEALGALYGGLDGQSLLAPLMGLSAALLLAALVVLLTPRLRGRAGGLTAAAVLALLGLGLDKGYGLVVGGFMPTPLGGVPTYAPTLAEAVVAGGIWGIGALIVVVCCRVALAPCAGG
jgi:molybdopterin-containing oxidoreductase family membrane subunit